MIRTGIYGGSFNPIHQGHVQLSKALLETGLIDELWLLVSPQNPLKVSQTLLEDEARFRLAKIAVEGIDGIKACDYEFHLPRPSYMVHTLEALRHDFPEREFVLVVGADNWERFHQWYRHEEILCKHQLIVYPRPGCQLGEVPQCVTVVDTPLLDISSTEIREKINSPDYHGEGLCPKVWEEIKRNKFYLE